MHHSEVAWEAPEGCPAADEVRARVVEHLGRPLGEGEVDARMKVTGAGAHWRVEMTVRTAAGDGERALEAASCRELAEAAALILALTIDPMAGSGAPAADPPAEPTTETLRREVAALGDDEDPPLADLRRDYRDEPIRTPYVPVDVDARFRLLVGGDLGTLPGAAPGIGGAVEIAFGPWSGDVGVTRFAERDALMPRELETDMDKGAHVGLTSVVARLCYSAGPRRWRAGGCAGGDLSFTRSTGFGFEDNAPQDTSLGGGPQLGVMWAMQIAGPLALRADVASTFLAVRRYQVESRSGTVLHDPNLVVWRAFAGVEATWE